MSSSCSDRSEWPRGEEGERVQDGGLRLEGSVSRHCLFPSTYLCSPFLCHFYSHAEVCKPGILYFFKDKKAASSALAMARSSPESAEVLIERAATGKVDLRQVTEFSIPAESNVQLFIKRPKEMVKIRQVYVFFVCYILVVTSSYVSC